MDQTKLESATETFVQYAIGFNVAWLTWTLLYWGPINWGWLHPSQGFAITCVFTCVSMIRSYVVRRFFARGLHKAVHAFAVQVIKLTRKKS